jgi:hypothetical protein
MKLSEFRFDLPQSLIALNPTENRWAPIEHQSWLKNSQTLCSVLWETFELGYSSEKN